MRQNKAFFVKSLKPIGSEGTIQMQIYKMFLGQQKERGGFLQRIIHFWESYFWEGEGMRWHCLAFTGVRQAGKTQDSVWMEEIQRRTVTGESSSVESVSPERFSHIHYVYKALLPYGFSEGLNEQSLHATPAVTNAKGNHSLQTLLNCSLV